MLQQYLISIHARLRSRYSTVSLKAETAECLVAWDSIIAWCLYKRSRLFKYIWIIQIYFSYSGRFLCVNAYFVASIHLILFFVSTKPKRCGIYKRHFLYAQLKFVDLKYLLRTSRVCDRSLTLASMCFLYEYLEESQNCVHNLNIHCQWLICMNNSLINLFDFLI